MCYGLRLIPIKRCDCDGCALLLHPFTLLFYVPNLCFIRGLMAALFQVIMKRPNDYNFCVRTFRGYDCVNHLEDANSLAHSMILEIIADEWCSEYWWAEIRQMATGCSWIVTCLEVGYWITTPLIRLT